MLSGWLQRPLSCISYLAFVRPQTRSLRSSWAAVFFSSVERRCIASASSVACNGAIFLASVRPFSVMTPITTRLSSLRDSRAINPRFSSFLTV